MKTLQHTHSLKNKAISLMVDVPFYYHQPAHVVLTRLIKFIW